MDERPDVANLTASQLDAIERRIQTYWEYPRGQMMCDLRALIDYAKAAEAEIAALRERVGELETRCKCEYARALGDGRAEGWMWAVPKIEAAQCKKDAEIARSMLRTEPLYAEDRHHNDACNLIARAIETQDSPKGNREGGKDGHQD